VTAGFVVLEGGEGAGKTTQIDLLAGRVRAAGVPVTITREPGATPAGQRIRALLLDPASELTARTEALLYAADRAQHVAEIIRPALRRGDMVISDRYVDSSLAYQGIARGLGVDRILEVSAWATSDLMPDLTIYLDIDPAAAHQRLDRPLDRLESEGLDFHTRVRDAYLELAARFGDRIVVIDASVGPSQVHEKVVHAMEERGLPT
jgi:dTMP kinase